jgi:hypothetical protein
MDRYRAPVSVVSFIFSESRITSFLLLLLTVGNKYDGWSKESNSKTNKCGQLDGGGERPNITEQKKEAYRGGC